jgi:hypothetical protein
MQNNKTGNILICGSQNFNDRDFVHKMLDTYYIKSEGNVSTIYTSRFSGACEMAREWVAETNEFLRGQGKTESLIKHRDCTFDMLLAQNNQSIYEDLNIPEYIVKHDPFFNQGKEQLIQAGVNLVFAFPNPEGILGPSTHNIVRFAQLASVPFFDCSEALKAILAFRNEPAKDTVTQAVEKDQNSNLGFQNKHPAHKIK